MSNNYRDPSKYMLDDIVWLAIWDEIKTWDINVPSKYNGYCGATGNHATAIYLAITAAMEKELKETIDGNKN